MSDIRYSLKRSSRARALRISVLPGGEVRVVAPEGEAHAVIDAFVRKHEAWIRRASKKMSQFKRLPVSGRRDYLAHKEAARAFVKERVEFWNRRYGFTYVRISIKDTKRLWGSCSRKGNLNFSYTLLFLPPALSDYVVVHELCHLREHNHGPRFWALVGEALPGYKALKKELATYVR